MIFKYEAMDATGIEVRATIEANNEEEAKNLIRKRGLYITKIKPIDPPKTNKVQSSNDSTQFWIFAIIVALLILASILKLLPLLGF